MPTYLVPWYCMKDHFDQGFPCGSAGKESAHNMGDLGSINLINLITLINSLNQVTPYASFTFDI